MILIDTNILVYAVNQDERMHQKAKEWLEQQFSSAQVGLPWLVLIAFLRICTNRRILPQALTVERATGHVNEWLELPNVSIVEAGDSHWPILARLLLRSGTGGNLTNDAHLAAIAIEQGALLCSADNDFRRFEGVQYFNPFEENSVREPMLSYAR